MRAVLQRCTSASVTADGELTGEIGAGLVVLLGIGRGDTESECRLLAGKIAAMRIFSDSSGKLNRSIIQTGGSALVIPNFTLYADCRRGSRPDFTGAESFREASGIYEYFLAALHSEGIMKVEAGRFGAHMQLRLTGDGPVTILIDSEDLR